MAWLSQVGGALESADGGVSPKRGAIRLTEGEMAVEPLAGKDQKRVMMSDGRSRVGRAFAEPLVSGTWTLLLLADFERKLLIGPGW